MAIQKQINILREGIAIWNEWRKRHPDTKVDLRRANLSGANLNATELSEADLSRTNLSRTYLVAANLSNANLSSANLRGAHLRETNLIGANLNRADLRGAYLSRANLNEANLSEVLLSRANLSEAYFSRTHLDNIDLSQVVGLEYAFHSGPSYISTSTLSRSHGNISDVFLKGAGLDDILIEYLHSLTTKPFDYYTCFISYSSKDELFARRLHNDLQQGGVRCWFASEDMNIGDKIRYRIDESIKLYDKLLLILSEHSIESTWVEYEVEKALDKEPHGTHNVLYPVQVDQAILTCHQPWAQNIKNTRHIGNFEHWTNPEQYQENFQRLLRALNTKKDQGKS